MKYFIGIIVLIIVFVGIVMVVRPSKPLSDLVNSFKLSDYSINLPPSTLNVDGYSSGTTDVSGPYAYQLSDTSTNPGMDAYGKIYNNSKLLRVYSDGRRETVIENMRNKFPGILLEANHMLTTYAFPRNSDILYFNFRDYYTKGVNNRYHIYRYDVNSDTMRDLLVNRYLTSYVIPSPYNPLVMLAVDDDLMLTFQRLYLINLETDSARLLLQLGGDETLASSAETFGKLLGPNVNWVDQSTIQYSIYRNSNQQGVGFTFLGNKMLTL